MNGYLDDAKSLEDAVCLAIHLAYVDGGEGDVVPSILADEVMMRVTTEVNRLVTPYRNAAIAASNLVPQPERDAIRHAVGLPPAPAILG